MSSYRMDFQTQSLRAGPFCSQGTYLCMYHKRIELRIWARTTDIPCRHSAADAIDFVIVFGKPELKLGKVSWYQLTTMRWLNFFYG